MQRIPFIEYLRSNQLHREVSTAVRYAKDTPRKRGAIRAYFAAALAELDALNEPIKETE